MVTENTQKQLLDYRKHGKKLKYLINYLMGLIKDEDDFEKIILQEMKELAFNEDEIVKCMEYDFGLDMSWHRLSVSYNIEKRNKAIHNINELLDHLVKIIEDNDKRFSFELSSSGETITMEIYDKEKDIGCAVHIEPFQYNENGYATNL